MPKSFRQARFHRDVLRVRVKELEEVIQTQNGVVVSGTLKLNEARARVAKLEAALKGLVERLDEINAHPEFKSVWTLHYVHGGRYGGPSWVEPLEAARIALEEAP